MRLRSDLAIKSGKRPKCLQNLNIASKFMRPTSFAYLTKTIQKFNHYFLYMRMIALCMKLISYNISSLSSAPSMSLIY